MTFNPAIPQPNDLLSISQGDLLTNFSQTNTIFAVNHYEFNHATVADRGKHKFCSFPEQAADPSTAANEIALYTKDNGGATSLYYREESDGDVHILVGGGSIADDGYIWLGSGLLMQWGHVPFAPAAVTKTVTFPIPFPTKCLNVQANFIGSGNGIIISAINVNTFTFRSSASENAPECYWIALGN